MSFNKFKNKVWLSSPTMHGEELDYIKQAYDTNWMSTLGENVDKCEELICNKLGSKYAVALCNGTAAVHLALKLAAEEVYGKPEPATLSLLDKKVFSSDMTFAATANPIIYEGGKPIFIDSEFQTWNLDPDSLELAFQKHHDVKIVCLAHLYGTPAQMDQIKHIVASHNAILVEDAAESLGATYNGQQTGTFGKYNCISFNGNKIITGSSGGMFLTNNEDAYLKVKKWSTQSREQAPWYHHTELGYNYRISNVIAGVVRGQVAHLDEHIAQKKLIYERYAEGLKELPISMNPHLDCSVPNYWLSCMTIDRDYMCEHSRSDCGYTYKSEPGKSCPDEIIETLAKYNIEARPIWKPLHSHPFYSGCDFVSANGDVSMDIFDRGLCLPSDNKMTPDVQDTVIEIIKSCFE